ncbi:MAG: tetratricopeptide repeat protein [Hyphomonadaceae bacterium]|nr:tetratricopeptide repeat protein [Hyphomonadaceae bacterium]
MKFTLLSLAAIAAAALAGAAGTATAATIIMGTGPALACYQAANMRRADVQSVQVCDSALEDPMLTPRDRAATRNNRGILMMYRRNAAAALTDFEAAARLQPAMGESFVNRGAAQIMLGDYAGAIESLNRGLELGSAEQHEAYFNRAIANEQSGNLRAAYEDYRRALELRPDWLAPQTELQRFSVRRTP